MRVINFINTIQELLPAAPNTDKENLNYLMNAEKLVFDGDYSNDEEFTWQVQINKCVRAIKKAAGDEIAEDEITENYADKNIYIFYINGERVEVIHTDEYIKYNGKYYRSPELPHHLVGALFTAYFLYASVKHREWLHL
ncbi:MAG: hypothetical protein GXZ01_10050 [Clostridiaceae bacterium]|jgi:hypothetical protein|nr:hypothetical protein [Clostridiaceae bacterium]